MSSAAAIHVVNEQINELLARLPSVRAGDSESIHQARVATRRLREALPLLSVSHPAEANKLRRLARKVRRRLSRIRELDVICGQLETLEERVPSAITAIARARVALRAQHERRQRSLIKGLEKAKVDRLRVLSGGDGRLLARLRPYATARAARRVLRLRIGERARAVAAAVDRSAGLHFPNRLHAVRIAVKKLRYSVELAEVAGLWRPPRLLRDLRRIQARLGAVHDQQVLLDALDDIPADTSPAGEATALKAVVRSDLVAQYTRYLSRVERLRAICAACQRFASRPAPAERHGWIAPLSVLAAPVGLALLAEQLVPGKAPASRIARELVVQIP
jgi:CHAD domain-containing protein